MNYYNDSEKFVCRWLENLIMFGHIPNGIVDCRPIQEITPNDLKGFTQCHFFAGIGGGASPLNSRGGQKIDRSGPAPAPANRSPSQGNKKGSPIPATYGLPGSIFKRNAALQSSLVSRLQTLLTGSPECEVIWAVWITPWGGIPIEAACAGAAQYRDRFWFVAERDDTKRRAEESRRHNDNREDAGRGEGHGDVAECGVGVLAPIRRPRLEGKQSQPQNPLPQLQSLQRAGLLNMVRPPFDGWGQGWTESEFRGRGFTATVASLPNGGGQFIGCPDGKYRRLPPPRVRWLGNGIPSRVAQLRALGNSIYPPVAAAFIRAYMETL